MDLTGELQNLEPRVTPSSWKGFEQVHGFGVMVLPLSSGHVLALRVFPENDFAPYITIWHRSPDKQWEMYVDSPSPDTCLSPVLWCRLHGKRLVSEVVKAGLHLFHHRRFRIDPPSSRLQLSIAEAG